MTPAGKTRLVLCVWAMMLLLPGVRMVAQEAAQPTVGARNTPTGQAPEKSDADENDVYRKSPSVQKMGRALGMNPDQSATAFEVFNFVTLAVLVGWLLVKMLPKTFRTRSTAIQKHLVEARTATEDANARLGSVEARLGKLDGIIAEMRAQAEKDAVADEQRIKASLEDEKNKILAAAEGEIAAATVQARRELQKYAAELAIDQAGRKLVVNAETDRLLVQGFARRLSEGNGGGKN